MPQLGYNHNGEYIARCSRCGDSNNPNHGHLYLNPTKGTYYCFRCGNSGKLDLGFLHEMGLDLDLLDFIETEKEEKEEKIEKFYPFPFHNRFTLLNTSSAYFRNDFWDYFTLYDVHGYRVGYTLRTTNKDSRKAYKRFEQGNKGIAYPYAPKPLKSSLRKPLTLVEGPYDVLEDNDVCIFGTLSSSLKKIFIGHYVILAPDGDVWTSKDKYEQFKKTAIAFLYDRKVVLIGLRIILNGKDIDEAMPDEVFTLYDKEMYDFLLKEKDYDRFGKFR